MEFLIGMALGVVVGAYVSEPVKKALRKAKTSLEFLLGRWFG